MIVYKQGNLLDDEAEALVNTVNLVGVMGKGIALAFKQAFPHNFEVYRKACASGALDIGAVLPVKDNNLLLGERLIINLPTKKHWRQPSEYSYIAMGLTALVNYLSAQPVKSLAMPALGCGNGGLDWQVVRLMIEKQLSPLEMRIHVYEPQV